MDPELRDWLERIRRDPNLSAEEKEALDEMERELQERQPGELRWVRLLVKFLEIGRRRMPPVVRDFIKLYAKALESGAGMAGFLGCKRYEMLRAQGASHEDAVSILGMDPDLAEWCRLRYALNHLPLPEAATPDDAPGIPDAPAQLPEIKPDENKPPPSGHFWSDADHDCCSKGGADQPVAFDWGDVHIVPAIDAGHTRKLTGRLTLSHPCGLLFAKVRLFLGIHAGGKPLEFFGSFADGNLSPGELSNFMKIDRGATTWTIELRDISLSPAVHDLLQITAVSRCFTDLPHGVGEQML